MHQAMLQAMQKTEEMPGTGKERRNNPFKERFCRPVTAVRVVGKEAGQTGALDLLAHNTIEDRNSKLGK